MLQKFVITVFRFSLIGLMAAAAQAQPTGLLYDPEPPADSAYVRVLLTGGVGKGSIAVDGKLRVAALAGNQVSDYMVLPFGKHVLAFQTTGGAKTTLSASLDVVAGRAMTVAFVSSKPSLAPIVFEDKTGSNKLKAMLSVYQLVPGDSLTDVLTGDGTTQVFSGLRYGASAALPVNPVSIELIATKAGEKVALARAALAMTPGSAHSLFLLPDAKGKMSAKAVQNKVERYTGK